MSRLAGSLLCVLAAFVPGLGSAQAPFEEWDKQAVASRDPVVFWIGKADQAKVTEPHVKSHAVWRLRALNDPRALPVLRKLVSHPAGATAGAPFPQEAQDAISFIEGGVLFRKFAGDVRDVPRAVAGCRQLVAAYRKAHLAFRAELARRRATRGPAGQSLSELETTAEYLASGVNHAERWALVLKDERATGLLCMMADRGKVAAHLRGLGRAAMPYLLEECKSVGIESVAACLPLLAELGVEEHLPFLVRFLYCDDDPANERSGIVAGAAARAVGLYREKALACLEPLLLEGRNELAARNAAYSAYVAGGPRAATLLAKAIARHEGKPVPNQITLNTLRHYHSKLTEGR